MTSDRIERLAALAVEFAANVQPGQIVSVSADTGSGEIVRALTAKAYQRGANFVDAVYFDPYVKRARIEHADASTLDFVPPWYGERVLALGAHGAARITVTPLGPPGLLDGLDPARAGRDALPFVREVLTVINENSTNWTIIPYPTVAWASVVHRDLDPAAAAERLWEQIEHVCRLDEDDPVSAWRERMETLRGVAERVGEQHFSALHFEGPGTDLHVGLLPSSTWMSAGNRTRDGIEHLVNLPSEEIFTAPDPERVDGVVRATKPLDLNGTIVDGLRVRFDGGRAVEIDADSGAEALRAMAKKDDGAARLGEVALVDREGRVGALDTVFYETLLDENAASHVALGNAYEASAAEEHRARLNKSAIHVDFMIGGDDVHVTGVAPSGERVPVLRSGTWQL
ncbi:MAG: aminopeptidase [Actinomycetota bacterium]|nr:aminopeptidase [Actinomycetota bacterium]